MIDYILVEVSLSVPHHDRTMIDASVNSTAMTPSVSLCIQEPVPVLNGSTELPSSCSRNLQAVQVRPGAKEQLRRVSEGLRGTQDRSPPNYGRKSQTNHHSARRSLIRYMENSPYAEVRAVADNHDDPNMPASTFRSWVIGTLFIVAGRIFIWFFSILGHSISVGANVVQLLCVLPALIHRKQQLIVYHG
jgi:hypothetical protein